MKICHIVAFEIIKCHTEKNTFKITWYYRFNIFLNITNNYKYQLIFF